MRITILNQFYLPDVAATAHLAGSLAEHLSDCGHEVTVVASHGGYIGSRDDDIGQERSNLRVCRLWTPQFGKARLIGRLLDYVAFFSFAILRLVTLRRQDVVITLTTPPFIMLAAVLHKWIRCGRPKVVLWSMDVYPEVAEGVGVIKPNGFASRLLKGVNRLLLRRIDHVVCLDTAMRDLLIGQYSSRKRSLPASVIPNWERAEFFPADQVAAPWSETKRLGLDDRFIVLYLGNAGYGHRFETVMDAAEQMRDDRVAFLFVGGGRHWESIAAEKEKRRLDNIVMHGYVAKEETPAIMGQADCALITMRDSALGLISPSKLHSNLAMNLPIVYIGPETSNVDDAIGRFECGVSLRHGQVDQMVAYIRQLASDAEYHRQQKNKSRQAFDEGYCDRHTLSEFEQLLDQLTGNITEKKDQPVAAETSTPS